MATRFDGSLIFDTAIDRSGFESGIKKLESAAVAGVKAIAGITTAAIGFTGYAVKVGSEFEAAMSKVQAVSGASAEEIEALTAKAKEMGATTKFSASESAEALNYMAMAGWKTEDMLGGLEGIMNLAAASGEDLATTSDIVTDALTAFGLAASDSGHFADVLAKASSNSNTNVSMMGETFKYVAPLAGAMGYSIEDTAVAIGLMANAGIKGSEAGTALRATLTRLVKPPADAAAALNQLGITATNADGSMKPLGETMVELRAAFADLTEKEQANMAASIAGQEAMSGLLAIVNASPADFEKLTTAIGNANGAAAEMAAIMNDNLRGQITLFQSALEGLGVAIYEDMDAPLSDVVGKAAGYLTDLNEAYERLGYAGLVGTWRRILSDMLTAISDNAPDMIDGAAELIQNFLLTIADNADEIAEAGVQIVIALAEAAIETIPELANVAFQILVSLGKYIVQHLPELAPVAALLIAKFAANILLNKAKLFETGGKLIKELASKLKTEGVSKMKDVGKGIVDGVISGIKNNAGKLLTYIKDWAKSILSNAKKALGINSPSKLFRDEIGANLALGVEEGFEDKYKAMADKMRGIIGQQTAKLSASLSVDKGQPIPAGASGGGTTSIPVNIYYQSAGGTDIDAKRLGRKFGQEVEKELRGRGVK